MTKNNFDKVIKRTGTYSTQWDYVEDRFDEKNLLPFTISDMDFAAPPNIINALQERLDHSVFGYTRWNHSDYKSAIAAWFEKRFDSKIDVDWIIYSPSVIYSVAKIIELQSSIDDGVIIQTPAYDAFFKTIKASKRNLIENPLKYENGLYEIDFPDLESKLSHQNNKILLMCSPHNPTGRVWSKDELDKIISLCRKYDVFLISDEIHMDVLRKNIKHYPLTTYSEVYEKIVLCSSPSKSFNTPGLGGSYLLIPDEKLRNEFLRLLKNRDGLSSANVFGIIATMEAYTDAGEKWIKNLNSYIDENILLVKRFIEDELPELTFIEPEATYLAWIGIQNSSFTMDELQKVLIEKEKIAIMNGEVYGGNGELFLRLNVGCPRSKVEEGLTRLKKAIVHLREKQ